VSKPSLRQDLPTIVLLTVNEYETAAVLDTFVGKGKVPGQETAGGITYNSLGAHGGMRIIHSICEMGAGGVGAAQQRTWEAIEHWKPAAVIAVGIAFGVDEKKQKIGDVLVAKQIQDYDLGRVNEDGTITPRGDKPSCSDRLCNRLKQTDAIQKRKPKNRWPKLRFGLVLSGQKLVDNYDYRESLKTLAGEAIGGEMEGVGVYVAASKFKTDWIVLKAICDWGHNKNQGKKDIWQRKAAKHAALVLKTALDVGDLFPEGASVSDANDRKDYKKDISVLCELTKRNFGKLKVHTMLSFGSKPSDWVHIERRAELSSLLTSIKKGHLLLTGEPGCGKSGLIYALVNALQAEGAHVVLLLAEEVFHREWKNGAYVLGLKNSLDEVLANWQGDTQGILITDALDAVRDVETQKLLRCLLRDVQEGKSGWTVVASVREFDLKHGRELREAFPGNGVDGFKSDDFAGVAHFHLSGLSESELDELSDKRPEILPFIVSARKSPKSAAIHLSPFYLRLAADLLKFGVSPARLADWNSPAVLLRKFWSTRIEESEGADEREALLSGICRKMVNCRSMVLSTKELAMGNSERGSLRQLRSSGIFQGPILRHGTPVGNEEIRFTHHLLYDYAISKVLIPAIGERFCQFVIQEPLLPVFYRQSFIFALEELWDADATRNTFWESALRLESFQKLHGLTRNLAPILAARRVETLDDLQPLLTAVRSMSDVDSPAQKALQHLAAGLQDASPVAISAGAIGWCDFAKELAELLPSQPSVEGPLVHILARLNSLDCVNISAQQLTLNTAGRILLTFHVEKEVSKGWRYAAHVAIEAVCRTFKVAPLESEQSLLALMTQERLTQFPHNDLHDLADKLKHLGPDGSTVVLSLFEAAFANEPGRDNWEDMGSAILPLRFQSSDQWKLIHYVLADYYEASDGQDVALMTEAACIAWNAAERRRGVHRLKEKPAAVIIFRGEKCPLPDDYSYIHGRQFEHDENRIVTHFEKLLDEWASKDQQISLNTMLNSFATRNKTSLMWSVLLEAGSKHPSTLGIHLSKILEEPIFLTHADFAFGGTALLGALHKMGDGVERERLERLILNLPKSVRLPRGQHRSPTPTWVENARNRLLGALEEPNVVLAATRAMWLERQTAKALTENAKPKGLSVIEHTFSQEELAERRGINLKDPVNDEMFHLREALKPLLPFDNNQFDLSEVNKHWLVVKQCQSALRRYGKCRPEMAEDLWGYLVCACENIAAHATWPKTDKRWQTIRRILLKAAVDPKPKVSDGEDTRDDGCPGWGIPSPRISAAQGLPYVAFRLGNVDKVTTTALRRLCRDKSQPLRFNLAERITLLYQHAPDLMWDIIDLFVTKESKFSVMDGLLLSLDRLWKKEPEKVMLRLREIANSAQDNAPADHPIHETLGCMYLFQFLRKGNAECEEYINGLIDESDTYRANHALAAQLHGCRDGGWMTSGDGITTDPQTDARRARTWNFLAKLLTTAQAKLQQHREKYCKLNELNRSDSSDMKTVMEKIDLTAKLVDAIGSQLYFASGAFDEKRKTDKVAISPIQHRRFWQEASPLFSKLALEPHPHTAHQLVQTLRHLMPCAPRDAFLLATKSIISSSKAGFQHESLAVGEVVKLIQRALADHREIFQSEAGQESECLAALLEVLDLFIEAGWPEARQLTHRLEEIYR